MSSVGRTILVLEDEPALREVLTEMLEDAGYSVIPAATARDALAVARTILGSIDLIVADVGVPGASGSEVAEAVRTRHPAVGVLYISGQIDAPLGKQAARVTGARFLRKPFRHEELLQEVERLLAGR